MATVFIQDWWLYSWL